jgi:muconolactone D-isomerase
MLFLLRIDVSLPPDMPQATRDDLRAKENVQAFKLVESGKLRRIWRIVGTTSNHSIWEAGSLEEMHANVQSLPMYAYMTVTVTPLVEHPVTAAWSKERGALPAF